MSLASVSVTPYYSYRTPFLANLTYSNPVEL